MTNDPDASQRHLRRTASNAFGRAARTSSGASSHATSDASPADLLANAQAQVTKADGATRDADGALSEARRVEAAARLRLLTGRDDDPTVILDLSQLPDRPEIAAVHDDAVDNATIAVEESRVALESARNIGSFRALLSGFAGVGAAESDFRSVSSSGSFGIYGLRLNLSYPLIGGSNGVAVAQARAQLAQSIAARSYAARAW